MACAFAGLMKGGIANSDYKEITCDVRDFIPNFEDYEELYKPVLNIYDSDCSRWQAFDAAFSMNLITLVLSFACVIILYISLCSKAVTKVAKLAILITGPLCALAQLIAVIIVPATYNKWSLYEANNGEDHVVDSETNETKVNDYLTYFELPDYMKSNFWIYTFAGMSLNIVSFVLVLKLHP